ncbi:MAG: Hcp family type VI secretion system effector [Planctomycetota bacterium]|jgi:type VI secretion system secreted protein Hcp
MKERKRLVFLLLVTVLLVGVAFFGFSGGMGIKAVTAGESYDLMQLPGEGPIAAAKVRGEAYMRIEGVPGECQDATHVEWIDILSAGHKISSGIGRGGGGDGGSSGVSIHEALAIVKEIDKTTPRLALYCCNGTSIPEVEIEFCRADSGKDGGKRYFKYKLSNVIINSVAPVYSHRYSGEYTHVEEVTLRYETIEWTYREYDEKGKAKGDVQTGWDLNTNSEI